MRGYDPAPDAILLRIAYLDESGVPELTGGTTHFVLAAVAIDGHTWKQKDAELEGAKAAFGLDTAEIHAGWMARRYSEQDAIPNFAGLDRAARRTAVRAARDSILLRRAALRGIQSVSEQRKNFRKTDDYIHLTHAERIAALERVASVFANWPDACVIAECTDKRVFGGRMPANPPIVEAYHQIVTRYHRHLEGLGGPAYGMLVQDRNDTEADRLTRLMRDFHRRGTQWRRNLNLLVETPLFVDSKLTSMVQVADVCAYALRRYLENGEANLFGLIFPKAYSVGGRCVGIRHYRGTQPCACRICAAH
jgi:hypothetical protein